MPAWFALGLKLADQQSPLPAYDAFLHLDPLHRREYLCQVLTVQKLSIKKMKFNP